MDEIIVKKVSSVTEGSFCVIAAVATKGFLNLTTKRFVTQLTVKATSLKEAELKAACIVKENYVIIDYPWQDDQVKYIEKA